MFFVFRENSFLSVGVRIQHDRSHTVIKTGPYRLVRHPMYASMPFLLMGTSLILNSLFSLWVASLIQILVALRCIWEEQTLRDELHGYKEYMKEVKYRLVPGLW